MIRLSGLELGQDIEIQFVGQRPGEKLFEELNCDGERHRPTSHPKIMVAEFRQGGSGDPARRVGTDPADCRRVRVADYGRAAKHRPAVRGNEGGAAAPLGRRRFAGRNAFRPGAGIVRRRAARDHPHRRAAGQTASEPTESGISRADRTTSRSPVSPRPGSASRTRRGYVLSPRRPRGKSSSVRLPKQRTPSAAVRGAGQPRFAVRAQVLILTPTVPLP